MPFLRRLGAVVAAGLVVLVAPACSARNDPTVIPFVAATVVPAAPGSLQVSWDAPGVSSVDIYVGPSPAGPDRLVGAGPGTGTRMVPAGPGPAREYVRLQPDVGAPLVVARRDLGLASDPNLRDVGGYRTADGRWVRMGVAYRSQALALTPPDAQAVGRLGLTVDGDLRTVAEVKAGPDVVPPGVRYRHFDVFGTGYGAAVPSVTTAAGGEQYMRNVEIYMVDSPSSKEAFGALLTTIATTPGATVYHCTAGKDRTGWASAVLLALLGVPRPTIMRDYLLSNVYYENSPAARALTAAFPPASAAALRAMIHNRPAYLQAGLDRVDAEYGSIDNYARRALGLSDDTIAALRRKLLTGSPS